ncbi:putative beta-ketoacyl synthase family protein [Paenibacillus sp. 598K]|uniref:beta-ketoacyl synthase N-terminal-like domain-containing protein n=1 Tax=Paenibacillus sp. 598K TaxID=1117987 RepID=UPI000FFA7B72|nr:beta-ketoacyl synthase N-terminal-like domain-containing protein [Paenibacillus sp. 598K]GBF74622.1 putative beta-ketoacyl synthase family protein [Paenibacillus sp. 598K]
MSKNLRLDRFRLEGGEAASHAGDRDISTSGSIAVIGMACRFGGASNPTEFWHRLQNGEDSIRDLPADRKRDLLPLLHKNGLSEAKMRFRKAAYLDEIDKFDPAFFRLSPKEAGLMDPNQRLFLECSWEAIEDAGYGGDSILGSRTGVFVGFSSDFGEEYKRMIKEIDPELMSSATVGNIKSVIASRIAYLLNLRGPSLLVDTACSSSLMAVHLACQAIRRQECDMALAGGVKLILMTLDDGSNELGIFSSDGRTKAFDNRSDGTGMGEGVGAVLLKPLERALADGDSIHGVIKGGAVNQDGASAGLTAPNSIAQQECITQAWKAAQIDPATISYMEAHGTGTKLGDPVEIDGLERAFRQFTERPQFCAIGSVKSNIGHTDHVAGIAGMMKVLLSMKQKQLPPHLHFIRPNQNIRFETSPVYVNDTLARWDTGTSARRAGISSFGLSGTNVHLVLEEAPAPREDRQPAAAIGVLTLSAMTPASLRSLLKRYQSWLANEEMQHSIHAICYTANVGRAHHSYRLAIVCEGLEDLRVKLNTACASDLESLAHPDIRYGWHKRASMATAESVAADRQAERLVQEMVRELAVEGLRELAGVYVQGVEVSWKNLYRFTAKKRVHLPVYPFERKRCWPDTSGLDKGRHRALDARTHGYAEPLAHPLLHAKVWDSVDLSLFVSTIDTDNWIVAEHKLFGQYVLPGTAYLEMAIQAGRAYRSLPVTRLYDFVFLEPVILAEREACQLQSVIRREGETIHFKVMSKRAGDRQWRDHAQGKLGFVHDLPAAAPVHVAGLQQDAHSILTSTDIYNGNLDQSYGPRFKNVKRAWLHGDVVLSQLELAETEALHHYALHPGLLDSAVGSMVYCGLLGNELYLPFSYKNVILHHPLPSELYCVCRFLEGNHAQGEIVKFQLNITDLDGKLLASIDEYAVKRVSDQSAQRLLERPTVAAHLLWEMNWEQEEQTVHASEPSSGAIAILSYDKDYPCLSSESQIARPAVELVMSSHQTQASFDDMMDRLRDERFQTVIFMAPALWHHSDEELITDLYRLLRALLRAKLHERLTLAIVTQRAYQVAADDAAVVPRNRALLALANVINQEHQTIRCIGIDSDGSVDVVEQIVRDTGKDGRSPIVYRGGLRYSLTLHHATAPPPAGHAAIKEQGVYMITGGLGGIGVEVASMLAEMNPKVTIALVGRTALPPGEDWSDRRVASPDAARATRMERLRDLEAAGARIVYCKADIADDDAVASLCIGLRQRFGSINGVIHAAGVAGGGFLFQKPESVFKDVLSPKVRGAAILDRCTEEDKLDFFVVFSSITGWLGGVGQGDYAAANAYLDAFAQARASQGKPTVAIAWSAWRETGMAVDFGAVSEDAIFKPLPTALALDVLRQQLMAPQGQLLVGELNYGRLQAIDGQLPIRLSSAIRIEVDKQAQTADHSTPAQAAKLRRVRLLGRSNEAYTGMEQQLADIWGDILGHEELNIHDNFYELGGDSIIAVRLSSHIANHLQREVDVTDIFNYLTIAELARFLDTTAEAPTEQSERRAVEPEVQIHAASPSEFAERTHAAGQGPAKQDRYDYANNLSWRQFNCYDRGLALMMSDAEVGLIQHFKLMLGMKRGFELQDDRFLFRYHDQQKVIGYPSDNELLQQFGYRVRLEQVEDPNLLHVKLAGYLDQHLPVMVAFDEYFTFYTPFYRKEHTDHLTILTGYDDDKQLYTIMNHNHLTRHTQHKISYAPFTTTYQTIEEIYHSLMEEARCFLILERLPDEESPFRYSYEQQFAQLMSMLEQRQQTGRACDAILALAEQSHLEAESLDQALNEIYVHLGGMELWIQTVLDCYASVNATELHQLGDAVLARSSRLVNEFVASIYRKRPMKPSDVAAARESLKPVLAKFIREISLEMRRKAGHE